MQCCKLARQSRATCQSIQFRLASEVGMKTIARVKWLHPAVLCLIDPKGSFRTLAKDKFSLVTQDARGRYGSELRSLVVQVLPPARN